MVGAVPTAGHEHWIVVNDSSVLDKIGRDPAYPLDGRYRQLVDIDDSGLSGPVGNYFQTCLIKSSEGFFDAIINRAIAGVVPYDSS